MDNTVLNSRQADRVSLSIFCGLQCGGKLVSGFLQNEKKNFSFIPEDIEEVKSKPGNGVISGENII